MIAMRILMLPVLVSLVMGASEEINRCEPSCRDCVSKNSEGCRGCSECWDKYYPDNISPVDAFDFFEIH